MIAIVVGFIYSESAREFFAEFRLDKNKRSVMRTNLKRLLPPFSVILIGTILTYYTRKLYAMLLLSVALSIVVFFLQSIKAGEYKKAAIEGEFHAYYTVIITLIIPPVTLFFMVLILIYGFNLKEIISLL